MNMADSERMAGTLESVGYTCAQDAEDADVIVYNTCSIRDKAEQKVYSALGRQVRLRIFVSFCMRLAQLPEIFCMHDLAMQSYIAYALQNADILRCKALTQLSQSD